MQQVSMALVMPIALVMMVRLEPPPHPCEQFVKDEKKGCSWIQTAKSDQALSMKGLLLMLASVQEPLD